MNWSEEQYADFCKRMGIPVETPKKQAKYRNVRTNGHASKREDDRAAELQYLYEAGEIAGVIEQYPFPLPGKIKYIADFVILNWDGTFTVEDAKGVKTQTYSLKKRLMKAKGLEIREV